MRQNAFGTNVMGRMNCNVPGVRAVLVSTGDQTPRSGEDSSRYFRLAGGEPLEVPAGDPFHIKRGGV